MVSSACRSFHKYTPLSLELAISPIDVYESPDDRALVIAYQTNLQNIFHNVRARYNPRKLEFFMISGISFRKVNIDRTFDTYLSLNTKISEQFSDDKTTFAQRASVTFEDFTKPLLLIAAQERKIFQNSSVAGVLINTRWKTQKTVAGKPVTLFEQLSLATRKEQIESFLNNQITDQELLDQSTVVAFNEGETPQIIKLHLE